MNVKGFEECLPMNLHAECAKVISKYLYRYQERVKLSVPNAEAKIYRKLLVFFMWVEMCRIQVRAWVRAVTGVVRHAAVNVKSDDWNRGNPI